MVAGSNRFRAGMNWNRRGLQMRGLLLGGVSVLALGLATPVLGADVAVKRTKAAPMVAAAPVFSWTGCYVGLSASGVVGRDKWEGTSSSGWLDAKYTIYGGL